MELTPFNKNDGRITVCQLNGKLPGGRQLPQVNRQIYNRHLRPYLST